MEEYNQIIGIFGNFCMNIIIYQVFSEFFCMFENYMNQNLDPPLATKAYHMYMVTDKTFPHPSQKIKFKFLIQSRKCKVELSAQVGKGVNTSMVNGWMGFLFNLY